MKSMLEIYIWCCQITAEVMELENQISPRLGGLDIELKIQSPYSCKYFFQWGGAI